MVLRLLRLCFSLRPYTPIQGLSQRAGMFLGQSLAALATTNSAGSEIEFRNAGWLDALEAALCIRDDNLTLQATAARYGRKFSGQTQ